MNKLFIMYLLCITGFLATLSACSKDETGSLLSPPDTPPVVSQSESPPLPIDTPATPSAYPLDFTSRFHSMSDDELSAFAADYDLCMIDSMFFTNPNDIDSETLFHFWLFLTSQEHYDYGRNLDKYQDNNEWLVPVGDIHETLGRYLESYVFDPAEVAGYYAEKDAIYASFGFGGMRFPKLADKSWSDDVLTITVDYYDDQYMQVYYTVTYRIRVAADAYFYLSVVKK